MGIVEVILIIIIIGVIMWLINTFIPMPGAIKALLNIVVFVLLIIWLLQYFGLIQPLINFPSLFRR